MVFLSSGSMARLPLSSAGSLGMVPPPHRYYGQLRSLPPLPAGSSPRRRVPPTCSAVRRPTGTGATSRRPGVLVTELPRSLGLLWTEATQALPGSWRTPMHARPALRPRPDLGARPIQRLGAATGIATTVAPAFIRFRGSITRPTCSLSTLRGTGRPCYHARLASGWWPAFAGRDWLPAGSEHEVSRSVRSSHPPRPGLAWRNAIPEAQSPHDGLAEVQLRDPGESAPA